MTTQEVNEASALFIKMRGTKRRMLPAFTNRLVKNHAGVIGVQECGEAFANALRGKGFFNTKDFNTGLSPKEKLGTALFLRENLFSKKTVIHIPHDYKDDKGRDGKLVVISVETVEKTNHVFCMVELRAGTQQNLGRQKKGFRWMDL